MKTLNQLYTELGLVQPNTKTASVSKEDMVIDMLKKIAESDSSDAAGSQKVPVNLGDAAANRPNGTTDNSAALKAFNSRENKPQMTDSSTLNASQIPAMTQGTTSHKLNEVPNQAPAQAMTADTSSKEVVAMLAQKVAQILQAQNTQKTASAQPDVDLDQVFKVAYINDYLGRQAAQNMMLHKAAQEGMMPPQADVAPAQAGADPTEEILAMLGQVSADELVAKKDALLAAIADVLDAEGGEGEGKEPEEAGEAKEAAAKLLNIMTKNPQMKEKIAAMLTK